MRRQKRKSGPLSDHEKRIALNLKALNPKLTYAAIAKTLNKRKAPIHAYLEEARRMLQNAAPLAADHVIRASAVAAARGDAGPAQWILERVNARRDDGSEVRAVDKDTQAVAGNGLTVNIGLAVANVPAALPSSPSPLPALVQQVETLAVTVDTTAVAVDSK